MKTLIDPRALLSNIVKAKVNNTDNLSFVKNINASRIQVIGVFSSHRDVKVAIEELQEIEFDLNLITLVARNANRHHWLTDLTIYNSFKQELFGTNESGQHLFKRLFQRGKYLLLVTGNEQDLDSARTIMSRRRGHAKVWYCQNDLLSKIG